MNGMNYLYLVSSNKHPGSNKRPPPRPLYQRSAPLPTIKCPLLPPYFVKKNTCSKDTRKTSFYGHLILNILGFNYNHWISVGKWFLHKGIPPPP